ncbi:MAG TPA: hypothetical protein VHK24_10075 [Steroidobacter sp.]|nr:hypothetical protein [Steroidobacter sp.]
MNGTLLADRLAEWTTQAADFRMRPVAFVGTIERDGVEELIGLARDESTNEA